MLDVDRLKERFNAKNPNTHKLGILCSVFWLNMYVLLVHARTIRGGGLFAGIRDNTASLLS